MVDDEEVGCGGGEEVTVLQWNILSQTLGIHGDFQAALRRPCCGTTGDPSSYRCSGS